MKRIVIALAFMAIIAVPLSGFGAAQEESSRDAAIDVPQVPAAVPVALDARTTAFLILDMNEALCAPRPRCVDSVPRVAALLERARAAGVPVVYSSGRAPTTVVAPLAPRGDEPLVMSVANKFFQTDLDQILIGAGAETLVIVGVAANGAPMYTSFEANARGYTVVVAEDGISSTTEFDEFLARYQLLNQPGFDNPQNNPMTPGRVTLSRTDLITFR